MRRRISSSNAVSKPPHLGGTPLVPINATRTKAFLSLTHTRIHIDGHVGNQSRLDVPSQSFQDFISPHPGLGVNSAQRSIRMTVDWLPVQR